MRVRYYDGIEDDRYDDARQRALDEKLFDQPKEPDHDPKNPESH